MNTYKAAIALAAMTIALDSAQAAPTVQATLTVGNQAPVMCTDSVLAKAFVPNFADGTLSIIDLGTLTVSATLPVGPNPRRLACNEATHRLYLVNATTPGTVTVVDAKANAVVATIPVGNDPRTLGANFFIDEIYVSNYDSDTVSIVSTATHAVVATVAVGKAPLAPASNNNLYKTYVPARPTAPCRSSTRRRAGHQNDTGRQGAPVRRHRRQARQGLREQRDRPDRFGDRLGHRHGGQDDRDRRRHTVQFRLGQQCVPALLPAQRDGRHGDGDRHRHGRRGAHHRRGLDPRRRAGRMPAPATCTWSTRGATRSRSSMRPTETPIGSFAVGRAPSRIYEMGDQLFVLNGNGSIPTRSRSRPSRTRSPARRSRPSSITPASTTISTPPTKRRRISSATGCSTTTGTGRSNSGGSGIRRAPAAPRSAGSSVRRSRRGVRTSTRRTH